MRTCLVARLCARRAQIEEEIFARVSDRRFDQTGSDDPEYMTGMRAAGTAVLDYVLAGVEHWGELLAPVPPEALAQARRAALAGVGLETVLRRYFAGHAVLEDFIMQEAEHGVLRGQGPALREVLAILCALVDRLSLAASRAYAKEHELQASGAAAEAMRAIGRGQDGTDRAAGSCRGSPEWDAVAVMRRERILHAFVEVAVERGLADTSVGLVVAQAKVSRRTLYELFPGGLEDLFLAVLDETGRRTIALARGRLERARSWQEGVREALAALLVFFDREPGLARMCLVEALAGGQVVAERREAGVVAFRELIVTHVERAAARKVPPLIAESTIASVMGIIYTRLLAGQQAPLIELLGPLMGLVMTPVGASKQIVTDEMRHSEELARAICAGAPGWETMSTTGSPGDAQAQAQLPALLANPTARRARQCLLYIADRVRCGHHPSNGEVAAAIDVQNKGQISRLLSQLQREGLLVKRTAGVAAPNAWSLTSRGAAVSQVLADSESRVRRSSVSVI